MLYLIRVEHRNGDLVADRETKERALVAGRWLCKEHGKDAQSVRVYRRYTVNRRIKYALVATFTYLGAGKVATKLA